MGPHSVEKSCQCAPGYFRKHDRNYGRFACVAECEDEPSHLLSRDWRECIVDALDENCGPNEDRYRIEGKQHLQHCDCKEGYAVGYDDYCSICADNY